MFYICNFLSIGFMGKDGSEYRIYLTNLLEAKIVYSKEGCADWKDPTENAVDHYLGLG